MIPEFCHPWTLSILSEQPNAPITFATTQTECWFGKRIYHRVTPGLLQWLCNTIGKCVEDNVKDMEKSIEFYRRLVELSGLQPDGTPVNPHRVELQVTGPTIFRTTDDSITDEWFPVSCPEEK